MDKIIVKKQKIVTLKRMNNYDFDKFLIWSINNYAEAKIKAKNWKKDEAFELSKKAFEEYLPQGLETKNHYLFCILNKNLEEIGHLWYFQNNDTCFIYDFLIVEKFRRQGFATKCLEILEKNISLKKISYIKLHVFGHNIPAIKLYEKYGFILEDKSTKKNINMSKKILRNSL